MTPDTDVLVVGASAAGLATASRLAAHGVAVEVLEAGDAVAGPWRRHYDRLHLHTPRSLSALPGLAMPRAWGRYPSRAQVVEYLEVYAHHFGIRPHLGQHVTSLDQVDGGWEATTPDRTWRARTVVVATGRARVPVRPTWPGMDEYTGDVLHSSEYRNGDPWAGRPVLVVGFGNSACEQALDLVERGAQAHMSVRSPVNVVPRDVLGLVPVLQLGIVMSKVPPRVADALAAPVVRLSVGDLKGTGLRKLPYGPNTQIAEDKHIPLLDIGTMDEIRAGRITVHGAVERFTPTGVVLEGGSALDVAAVVLGTGYRAAVGEFLTDWRKVCDEDGTPLVSGGPSGLDGLYFCGMDVAPDGMLRAIGHEAERIARHVSGTR